MAGTLYMVETQHPSLPEMCGTFTLEVVDNGDCTLCVKGAVFGYSKACRTRHHRDAIWTLLREHGCRLVAMSDVPSVAGDMPHGC